MNRRRMIRAAAVVIALAYCSVLAYQSGMTFVSQHARSVREIETDFSIEPVTKTTIYDIGRTKNITLGDVFISVKTTRQFQYTRLPIILKTWFNLAKEQIWFFTDIDNPQHQKVTNGHMINTNCSAGHGVKHLCCKLSVEYDHFLESGKKWFCHFDDDNYVNVPQLVNELQKYNPQEDWYLGRTSVYEPVSLQKEISPAPIQFWFATGGAGFCLSRSLALKMVPVASGGRFMSICDTIRLPDDVSMGFVVEHLMKKNLTQIQKFHSHLEQMKLLDPETFREQISFGYSKVPGKEQWNVVEVPGFDTQYDPSRFLSLHCFLFPNFEYCPR